MQHKERISNLLLITCFACLFSDLGNVPYRLMVSFESQITPVTKSAAWTVSIGLSKQNNEKCAI